VVKAELSDPMSGFLMIERSAFVGAMRRLSGSRVVLRGLRERRADRCRCRHLDRWPAFLVAGGACRRSGLGCVELRHVVDLYLVDAAARRSAGKIRPRSPANWRIAI
jgi:hypothetical protein